MRNIKLLLVAVTLFVAITGFVVQRNTHIPTNEQFIIQSAMSYGKSNTGVWDIPGGKNPKLKDGKNVEVWEKNGGADQYFTFTRGSIRGYYEIYTSNNPAYRVNVDGGSAKNGTNVELWSDNNNKRQNLKLVHQGNGRFKIYTETNRVVCLDNRSNHNGSNIHIWEDHDGPWMEWYLINVRTGRPYIPGNSHRGGGKGIRGGSRN